MAGLRPKRGLSLYCFPSALSPVSTMNNLIAVFINYSTFSLFSVERC